MKEKYLEKIKFVFTTEILKNIKIDENNNEVRVIVDIHGYTVIQAKRIINTLLNLIDNSIIKLMIIHGYNHGTALKEALRREVNIKKRNKQFNITDDISNLGVTYFSLI